MNRNKLFLYVLAVPFLLIQTYWTFAPGSGIVDRYGFFNAFPKYFDLNWGDPLLMAGITDFMTVITIGLVWMVSETPPERRWTAKFYVWLTCFVVFPGLGFLMFFLFLNPDHRFVSASK